MNRAGGGPGSERREEPGDRPSIAWQPSLFAAGEPAMDPGFTGLSRVALDGSAWVDHVPGWVQGGDALFGILLETRRWAQRSRRIYDREVLEPRLTSLWTLASGEPLEPPILDALRRALSERYGPVFDSIGFNLYRDGRDSVAWHRDRIRREIEAPIVALLALGAPRRLLLRPRGGGASTTFRLESGDLLVTGGTAQRTWEHCVPKVARAGPRISLAFRHGLDPSGYGRVESLPARPLAPSDETRRGRGRNR